MRCSTYAPTRLSYEAMSHHPDAPILKVQELAIGYGAELLQHDVSFDVKRGSIFAIMGASGSGDVRSSGREIRSTDIGERG